MVYSCLWCHFIQYSSVAQSCPTLWDPMNRSTPGFPVHHQLLESTQTKLNICCCSSVAKSCLTFCDPMDCRTPGSPVLYYLSKFAQTHVYWVGDAIQPSHPLFPPPTPAFNLSQHQDLFQWVALHIRWPKYWSFSFSISPSNEYSGLISFRIDWFALLAVQETLKSLL